MNKTQPLTAVLRQAGFRLRLTVLWLKKVQFSEQTFVLKSPPIANLQNVIGYVRRPLNPTICKVKGGLPTTRLRLDFVQIFCVPTFFKICAGGQSLVDFLKKYHD